jgi:hypothetical protein
MIVIMTINKLELDSWEVTFFDAMYQSIVSNVIDTLFSFKDRSISFIQKTLILPAPAVIGLATNTRTLARVRHVSRFCQEFYNLSFLLFNPLCGI